MNIVLVMPFYDQNEEKRKLTKLQFKYQLYIKEKLKELNTNIDFVLVGSEGDISKKFVTDIGFREDEYFEFDQTQCKNVLDIIQKKYEFGNKMAIEKYTNLDILIMNSSNDFVPFEFYENLLAKHNKEIPQLGLIDGYKNGGFYCFINNNFDNVYIKNKCYKSKTQVFLSGCFSFNKKVIELSNNEIIFPGANEYTMIEHYVKKLEPNLLKLTKISLQIKIDDCDFTQFRNFFFDLNPRKRNIFKNYSRAFIKSINPRKYKFNNKNLNQFIELLKNLFN